MLGKGKRVATLLEGQQSKALVMSFWAAAHPLQDGLLEDFIGEEALHWQLSSSKLGLS